MVLVGHKLPSSSTTKAARSTTRQDLLTGTANAGSNLSTSQVWSGSVQSVIQQCHPAGRESIPHNAYHVNCTAGWKHGMMNCCRHPRGWLAGLHERTKSEASKIDNIFRPSLNILDFEIAKAKLERTVTAISNGQPLAGQPSLSAAPLKLRPSFPRIMLHYSRRDLIWTQPGPVSFSFPTFSVLFRCTMD